MTRGIFWSVLVISLLWRIYVSLNLDLCFDETYYFYWSLFPQLSYFDHPPLTAWAMSITNALLGETKLSVRIWPILAGVLMVLIGRSLATSMFDKRAGNTAAVFLLLSPVYMANGFIMTPDTLFALAWATAIYGTWQALNPGLDTDMNLNCTISNSIKNMPSIQWHWWIVVGLATGFGLLCKYNMVLFFLSLALLFLFYPKWRSPIFFGGGLAGIIALAVFSPVIIWNAENDWISFLFQLKHGFSSSHHSFFKKIGNYLGGLLIIVSPLICILCIKENFTAICSRTHSRYFFLASFFWPVIVFFGYSSLKGWVQPNWPMMAFFSGLILLSDRWKSYSKQIRSVVFGSVVFLDLVVMAYFILPDNFSLSVAGYPLESKRMREFRKLEQIAENVRINFHKSKASAILPKSHQLFGIIAFYAPELRDKLISPWDAMTDKKPRFPWLDDRKWTGQDILLVNMGAWEEGGFTAFSKVEFIDRTSIEYRPAMFNEIFFYLGHDFNIIW